MNEMLVAVFDTEDAAARGMRTLNEFHDEGGISLYGSALIVKNRDGRISVKQHSGEAPLGTGLGLMMGGIVGILGGPAGAAVGASLGGYLGLLADWARHGIDLKFLDDIGKTLDVGKAAVLAEIEQSWVSPLEQRLTQQGGTVFRRFRTDLVDDQLLREEMALQKALETLEDELDKATAAHREALLENVADVKQQLRTIQDRAKAAIELKTAETELKLKALRAQEEVAGQDTKAQIKKRVADAQADLEIRSKKLNEAWDLAKQALASQHR
jgi:uncharacterized membrane protein